MHIIFDKYYSKKPKKFIEIFMQNKHLQIDEIMNVFTKMILEPAEITAIEVIRGSSIIDIATRNQTTKYNSYTRCNWNVNFNKKLQI